MTNEHRMPWWFWVVMAPGFWAVGDVLFPLVWGEPSILLTYFGVHIGWGCG